MTHPFARLRPTDRRDETGAPDEPLTTPSRDHRLWSSRATGTPAGDAEGALR